MSCCVTGADGGDGEDRFIEGVLCGIIRSICRHSHAAVSRFGQDKNRITAVIVYDLGCANGHRFEGWFASSGEFERQRNDKLLTCPLCASDGIERLPHASYVGRGAVEKVSPALSQTTAKHYANLAADMMTKLVETIIEKTEDVGPAFPEEARKIHYREAPERHIRGTATSREVEALRDEGIEVVAVPVPLHRQGKTH